MLRFLNLERAVGRDEQDYFTMKGMKGISCFMSFMFFVVNIRFLLFDTLFHFNLTRAYPSACA